MPPPLPVEVVRRHYARIRNLLDKKLVYDITDALDAVHEAVATDEWHINERGNEVVAKVIYQRLKPTIVALHEARQPDRLRRDGVAHQKPSELAAGVTERR